MTEKKTIVVAGSGPAGLSSALSAVENGARVLLFERKNAFGCKLLASGGGKCNVSNTLSAEEFFPRFGREGRFLLPALRFAYHDWLFGFLKSERVEVRAADSFHYFPVSERACDILDAFRKAASGRGAEFFSGVEITEILTENSSVSGVKTSTGETIPCSGVILACGGTANPGLGGTDSGLRLARKCGHSISEPYPAMAPLLIREKWVGELTGISLSSASLSFRRGRNIFSNRGELLFTHTGFSGPCAIDLAGELAQTCGEKGDTQILLSLDFTMESSAWKNQFEAWRKSDGRRLVRTLLGWKFTHALADTVCRVADVFDVRLCELSSPSRDRLIQVLCASILTASGAGPMDKAMAMKGGVRLREVNPETLESRLVRGLFFAGEILDLVGPCGGYNIQWAFSSGRLAGASASAATE